MNNPVWAAPEVFWLEKPLSAEAQAARNMAWSEAQKLGLPGRKTEDYRYLNLKTLREGDWKLASAQPLSKDQQNSIRELVSRHALSGQECLVLVDGTFRPELSILKTVSATEFSQLAKSSWPAGFDWKKNIIRDFSVNTLPMDYFDHLNQSYFGRGVALSISGQTAVQILSLTSESRAWSPFQIWIEIKAGSECQVTETHLSLDPVGSKDKKSWSHPEVWVRVGEAATVSWVQCQNLNQHDLYLGRSRFTLAQGSKLDALNIGLGSSIARQNLDFHVVGEGVSATMNGLSLVGPGQVIDFHTLIDHQAGGSTTEQLYKGILGSDSQSVFNGKVIIRFGAQKASSSQLNQNLMLSDRAEIDSKPELEIFADDVKATHGSAIGQLNPDEVFYLQSRAIPEADAKQMLALGSVMGLLESLPNPTLKSQLEQELRHAYQRISQEII